MMRDVGRMAALVFFGLIVATLLSAWLLGWWS